jgi:hypothetical protein
MFTLRIDSVLWISCDLQKYRRTNLMLMSAIEERSKRSDSNGSVGISSSDGSGLSNAWDNPDWWGRHHKRLARAAEEHLIKCLKRGDIGSADAWSQVFSRHSKEAVKLMEFKRRMLLDVRVSRSTLLED